MCFPDGVHVIFSQIVLVRNNYYSYVQIKFGIYTILRKMIQFTSLEYITRKSVVGRVVCHLHSPVNVTSVRLVSSTSWLITEIFYLTTHSTHFIYGYMVKDHSDSEKGNPLPPHRLLFPINSKGSFICTIPQTG